MSRRAAGVAFCFIASVLFSMRYIVAAIYSIAFPTSGYGPEVFKGWLDTVGSLPLVLSAISLVIGITYIVIAEVESRK